MNTIARGKKYDEVYSSVVIRVEHIIFHRQVDCIINVNQHCHVGECDMMWGDA